MYVTVEQLRCENAFPDDATDERLAHAIEQATALIDQACGWYFERRRAEYSLSGTGTHLLELPVPPIDIEHVTVDREVYPASGFQWIGAPIVDSKFCVAKVIWEHGSFPLGVYNVRINGTWGYTVPSLTAPDGVPPVEIQRATMLLARRYVPTLDSDAAANVRDAWRLVEERTRDQSYRMQPREDGPLSGDPEVDAILLRYRRPMAMGAA